MIAWGNFSERSRHAVIVGRLAAVLVFYSASMAPSRVFAVDLGFAVQDGGQAGSFLDFGASARSLAMGKAQVAVTDDAGATYWNPSGLARVERRDVVTSYSQLYENTGYGFFSYAQPTIDWGTFGAGVVNLRSSGFDKRDTAGLASLGNFGVSDTALLLSQGFDATDRLSLGSTLKIIREEVDTFSGMGVGADVGAMWRASPALQVGGTLHNLLPPQIKLRDAKERFPVDVRAGIKFQATHKLLLATDVDQTANASAKIHMGGEWAFNDLLAFRAGLDETEVTVGLGFNFGDWGLDYAFGYNDAAAGVTDLGASHRFGFHARFGKKASEQQASDRWQKKGQDVLETLRGMMDQSTPPAPDEVTRAVAMARQVIRRQGYLRPQDLYAAQGYISYFEGDYERSVPSLAEALALEPGDARLARHKEKALAQMSEERTRQVMATEMKKAKDAFDKGDFRAAMLSCQTVLSFSPDDVEAKTYLEDARKKVYEPIDRAMRIGKLKLDRGEYLDAIKSFQEAKELDPDNKEATESISAAIQALEKQALAQAQNQANLSRPATEIEHNPEKSRSLYSQGLLLYSQGKVQDAANVWEQAVAYDNGNVLARNARDRAQIELKDKP